MQTVTSTTVDTAHMIGELCVGGDRACARGDLAKLASIALELAAHAPEPLHCELASLVDLCQSRRTSLATEVWSSLKDRLFRSPS